jgi:hypothetical protein
MARSNVRRAREHLRTAVLNPRWLALSSSERLAHTVGLL